MWTHASAYSIINRIIEGILPNEIRISQVFLLINIIK